MKVCIELNLDDVIASGDVGVAILRGTVDDAIARWCENSDDTSCGIIGSEFSTSGPGSGWTKNHDATDFAPRAMEGGALYYIDIDDGHLASSPEWEASGDEMFNSAEHEIEWTDESVIRLECPGIAAAAEYPAETAEMARAVIDCHHAMSDVGEWAALLRTIRGISDIIETTLADEMEHLEKMITKSFGLDIEVAVEKDSTGHERPIPTRPKGD